MTRLALLLVLAGVVLQEDAEIARWIEELGHEELARREKAQANLLKAGSAALFQLKAELITLKDGELKERVSAPIEEIERPAREKERDALARRQKLQLITLKGAETQIGVLLTHIEKEWGYKNKTGIDPQKPIRLSDEDLPLRQVLNAIEDELGLTITTQTSFGDPGTDDPPVRELLAAPGRPVRKPCAIVRGASFDVAAAAYQVDGKLVGWIVTTVPSWRGVESVEVKSAAGDPLKVELCGKCSPGLVLASTDRFEPLRVRLRGGVRWTSPYEFEVAKPGVSQTFRVGPFNLHYEFPKIRVTTSTPLDSELFASVHLSGKIKPGRGEEKPRFGGRFSDRRRKPAGWCQCEKGPSPVTPAVIEKKDHYDYQRIQWEGLTADDFESVTVHFERPYIEPFDVETVIPVE